MAKKNQITVKDHIDFAVMLEGIKSSIYRLKYDPRLSQLTSPGQIPLNLDAAMFLIVRVEAVMEHNQINDFGDQSVYFPQHQTKAPPEPQQELLAQD